MELPVFFQAEQAALAALLGVLLAALYDLLRALRRVLPGAAGFADGLFALVFFLSMLAFALYPGQGVFRLGFFLEIARRTLSDWPRLKPPRLRKISMTCS